MNLGIRAHDVKPLPFEELVKEIHEEGFGCCHLALYRAVRDFPVDTAAMTPGLAMYMKKVFEKNQVDVAILGCYKNLANPAPAQLAEITESYKAHIRFASLLGCGMVGTETGAVNTEYRYEPANGSEEALQIFIENLKPVVEYAEKLGVIFAIEPVWSHIVCNGERCRRVLDAVNSPNLQVIFDPVNQLNAENCEGHEDLIKEAFSLYGKEIAAIHAKDYRIGPDGQFESVASGFGQLNYSLLMHYVKKMKPHIHVTLEDSVPENALAARDYVLKKYEEA